MTTKDTDVSYAKQEFGTRSGETKQLGVPWQKIGDAIRVELQTEPSPPTKLGKLSQLAWIYDPLRVASPISLQGEVLHREACKMKPGGDQTITSKLLNSWSKWEKDQPADVTILEDVLVSGRELHDQTVMELVKQAIPRQDLEIAQTALKASRRCEHLSPYSK